MIRNILLSVEFAKRDLLERYVGTGFGQLWLLISPIVTIFIYTVIFSDFMKMKLDIVDSEYSYSIYLVPGLLAWNTFSTIILRLSNSFLEKGHLIKKVNIPMFTFMISVIVSEGMLFAISISLGVTFLLIVGHNVGWTFLWLIPIMALQLLFAFSIGVIISLFVPFFKDLKEVVPIVLQLWFWMTPIIYLKDMIYAKYPFLVDYNPAYYFIHIYQDIFLYSKPPQTLEVFKILALSLLFMAISAYLYKKMIGTIKDII